MSTGFGNSMIFTVFAMAKKEMSSLKTCIGMIPISHLKSIIDDQTLEMLTLSCTATELTIETVSLLGESPPQLSLLLNVINNALHCMVSVIVVDELHTVIKKKDAQHNSLYLV